MASVAVIHAGRLLKSRVALECYALFGAVLALWQFTWVHKVLANFSIVERGGIGSMLNYVSYAFLHTHMATQLALVVAAIAALALIVDTIRNLGGRRTFAY